MMLTALSWARIGLAACRHNGSVVRNFDYLYSFTRRGLAMSRVDPNFRIKGCVAAPVTPFTPDGELMLEAMPPYVQYLDEHGIDNVFVTGTMGEGMSLTVDERKRVAEYWMKSIESTKRLKTVMVHVGSVNYKESMELAKHAEQIGATAIACITPPFFKPANEAALVEYMAKVASAAPNTPFYYYDINFMTGCYLNTARFFELAADKIPNLRGGKITSPELPNLLDCTLAAAGSYQMMVGTDEQFLMSLAIGVDVPVMNSYMGNLYVRLKAAYESGDKETAMKEQIMARNMCQLPKRYVGGPAMVKGILRCLGVDLGSVRLPLQNLSHEQEAAMRQEIADMGFENLSRAETEHLPISLTLSLDRRHHPEDAR